MITPDDIYAPWSLCFDRDGTEDYAIILDSDEEELARSRFFWAVWAKDQEIPGTQAAIYVMKAAPTMLAALLLAQQALNAAPRFPVGDTDSYRIAAIVDEALAEANGGRP